MNNKGRQLVNYRPGGEWRHAYKRYFGKQAESESDIKMEYAKMQEGKLSSTFPQILIRIYNYHESKIHLSLFT